MLEEILKEISKQKKIAEMNLDEVDPRVRPYKTGQVTAAKQRLENLFVDYKNSLMSRAVFIMATGDKAEDFAKLAEEEFSCFAVDASLFFKEIANKVSEALYLGKAVTASLFDVVDNLLYDKLKRLDVMSYKSFIYNSKYARTMSNKHDFVKLLQEAIPQIVGGEVVAIDALERVAQVAVNKEYKSKMLPILIYSSDNMLINQLANDTINLSKRVRVVTAGQTSEQKLTPFVSLEDVTQESVANALKQIAANA
jgi:hypothetical protein